MNEPFIEREMSNLFVLFRYSEKNYFCCLLMLLPKLAMHLLKFVITKNLLHVAIVRKYGLDFGNLLQWHSIVRYADMLVNVCAEIWSRAYCIFPKTTHGKFYVAHEMIWL
jgi:hypothetical protein